MIDHDEAVRIAAAASLPHAVSHPDAAHLPDPLLLPIQVAADPAFRGRPNLRHRCASHRDQLRAELDLMFPRHVDAEAVWAAAEAAEADLGQLPPPLAS